MRPGDVVRVTALPPGFPFNPTGVCVSGGPGGGLVRHGLDRRCVFGWGDAEVVPAGWRGWRPWHALLRLWVRWIG